MRLPRIRLAARTVQWGGFTAAMALADTRIILNDARSPLALPLTDGRQGRHHLLRRENAGIRTGRSRTGRI